MTWVGRQAISAVDRSWWPNYVYVPPQPSVLAISWPRTQLLGHVNVEEEGAQGVDGSGNGINWLPLVP